MSDKDTRPGAMGAVTFERARAGSSSVALGSATAFIVLATLLSFVGEPGRAPAPSWRLRGTIAPIGGLDRAAQLPAAPKRA